MAKSIGHRIPQYWKDPRFLRIKREVGGMPEQVKAACKTVDPNTMLPSCRTGGAKRRAGDCTPETARILCQEALYKKRHREAIKRFKKELGLAGTRLDRRMAAQSLREERQAIRAYGQRIKKAKSPKLKQALRHARKEEREHAASFRPLARTKR